MSILYARLIATALILLFVVGPLVVAAHLQDREDRR